MARRVQVTEDLWYGYQWWKSSFPLDGRQVETFFAAGNGGSHIFVFPSLDLVVVTTGSAFGELHDVPQIRMMMNKYLLPAVVQDVDPHRGEPRLAKVPVWLFALCGMVLTSAVVVWPAGFVIRRVRRRRASASVRRASSVWLGLLRFLAGVNVLVVLLYLLVFLFGQSFFELVINSGYRRPLGPLELVLGPLLMAINLPITVLTIGMVVLAFICWGKGCWVRWEKWHFSATTAAACAFVFMLWHWGLAWLP